MARKTEMGKIGASAPLLDGSSTQVSVSGRAPEELCLTRVRLLAACYRKGEASDPEIYAAACAAILSEYPTEVVMLVTDPRTGLASKSQWLPTVKELKDACDEIVEEAASKAKRERDLERQFEDRRRFDAEQAAKANRPTYEEIVADCAKDGLTISPRPSDPTSADAVKRKHGISDAQWDQIPDQPDNKWIKPKPNIPGL